VPENGWIFRQDEARRCSGKDAHTSFGGIFRSADGKAAMAYFLYVEPI